MALVDLFIGEESGAEICERLRAAEPSTRVLLFSGAGEISASAARAAGASGFAYKDWPARRIAGAVRLVGLGGTVFERHEWQGALGLSERERAVLELMASGATNPEIGEALPFVKAHGQGALERRLPKARGAQPDRGGAAGAAAGPARLNCYCCTSSPSPPHMMWKVPSRSMRL